jgi:hypothetical protein
MGTLQEPLDATGPTLLQLDLGKLVEVVDETQTGLLGSICQLLVMTSKAGEL